MATVVSWNGSSFTVPATGEENWGGVTKVDGLLVSLANNGLQKTGGTFTLSADVDWGTAAGHKAVYYKSRGTVSTAGIIRLATTESVAWRNAADSGNNTLATDSSDRLLYNGVIVFGSTGIVPVAAGGTSYASYTTGDILYASGATALSKLAIGTADHVMYSTGSAPAYRLLVNASVSTTAAIARSKLADGTADHVIINSGAGVMTSEATLSPARGGTGAANNAAATLVRSGNHVLTITTTNTTGVTFPTTGTLSTLAGAESLTNKTFGDAQIWTHIATPSTPSAGTLKAYAKSDNNLYLLTSAGLESRLVQERVLTIQTKTTTYTALNTDDQIDADASGGAFTITLYAASNTGKRITIKNTGATGVVTISPASGTIDGASSFKLHVQYESVDITADGTNYKVTGYTPVSGTWTPTLSGAVNLDTQTASTGYYIKNKNIVSFAVLVECDITTSGITTGIQLSLPVASAFTAVTDLRAVVSMAAANSYALSYANVANDTLELNFIPTSTANIAVIASGHYIIK